MVRFHTVVTGAGISFEPPSNLPSGDALAVAAWESLVNTIDVPSSVVELVSRRILDQKLRLEQLLDVMTVGGFGMPLEVLVAAYVAVESTAFNVNHVALSDLPGVQHFTVNMDTLLEEAAAVDGRSIDITHLHGRWNHPGEISTTISQHLAQLDPTLEREFGAALAGKDVLVAGYSARDRDIQPLFLRYPPASLTWLVYPSEGVSPTDAAAARAKELAPEAIRLLDTLSAAAPTTVHEARSTIIDFLGAPRRLVTTGTSRGVNGALDEIRAAYGRIDVWRRQMAVAAVLANQGLGEHAEPLLRRIGIPRVETAAKIAARKMRARILRRGGHRGRAMSTLFVPVTTNYRAQIRSIANEAAATLPGTRLHWLADPVDTALLRRARGTTEFLIRTRLAQRQSARGELLGSEAAFRELGHSFAKAQVGLGNWVNLLTWHADVLKVMGRVQDAAGILRADLEETFYSDASQAGALNWKLMEVALVSRGPEPALLDALSGLAAQGPHALGATQHCWVQLTRFGASAGTALDQGDREVMARAATKRADTQMFWELQQAEVARAIGHFAKTRAHVREAYRIERDRSRWSGSATGKLAGSLISATADAQQAVGDPTAAVARFLSIATELEQLGAELPAARARVNAALAGGTGVGEDAVQGWKSRGWESEAARAHDPGASLADLWQIAM